MAEVNQTIDIALNETLNQTKQATQQLTTSVDPKEFLENLWLLLQSGMALLRAFSAWILSWGGYGPLEYKIIGISIYIDLVLLAVAAGLGFKFMKWRWNGGISFTSWLFWSALIYAAFVLI